MKSKVEKLFIGWVTGVILGCLLFGIPKCSAQTRQEVLKELHRQKVPHANIVLAQARLESGNFKSDFYKRTNNLFGLKRGRRYATYNTWRDSIKDYKLRISSRYNGGCYYKFLTRIGYASDKEYLNKIKEIANENRIYTLCGN